eukprot:scaffold23042_cov122-Isochrysis_galbana.AAC.1
MRPGAVARGPGLVRRESAEAAFNVLPLGRGAFTARASPGYRCRPSGPRLIVRCSDLAPPQASVQAWAASLPSRLVSMGMRSARMKPPGRSAPPPRR